MTMYGVVLLVHSYLRWVLVILALLVIARAFVGWRRGTPWQPLDERYHVALTGVVDLQFLIGLILYGLFSPFTGIFFADPGGAMKEPVVRFFAVEHTTAMLIAVALIHIGRTRSKRATGPARHRTVLIFTLVALVIMFLSIPWPNMLYGRPLFRGV